MEAEQRLEWSLENEKEQHAAQSEKWAQERAALNRELVAFEERKKARESLFSQVPPEARAQYELDREAQRKRFKNGHSFWWGLLSVSETYSVL